MRDQFVVKLGSMAAWVTSRRKRSPVRMAASWISVRPSAPVRLCSHASGLSASLTRGCPGSAAIASDPSAMQPHGSATPYTHGGYGAARRLPPPCPRGPCEPAMRRARHAVRGAPERRRLGQSKRFAPSDPRSTSGGRAEDGPPTRYHRPRTGRVSVRRWGTRPVRDRHCGARSCRHV